MQISTIDRTPIDHTQTLLEADLATWTTEALSSEEEIARQTATRRILECFCSKVASLGLQCLQLSSLPESLSKLTHLETLILDQNQLASLPESLHKLTCLKFLELSKNHLSSLPSSFGELSTIEHLKLSENQFTSFPEQILKLTGLKVLALGKNQISSLPDDFCKLLHLSHIDLANNRLSSLPDDFGRLIHIPSINLANNLLSSLPDSFHPDIDRTTLNLSGNRISSLPPTFLDLPSRIFVNLTNNPFTLELIEQIRARVDFRMMISIRETDAFLLKTLDEGFTSLQKESGKPIVTWVLSENDQNTITAFFQKLGYSYAYKDVHKKITAEFLCQCFALATENEVFRGIFTASLDEASSTCGDRVSLNLNYIYLQHCLFTDKIPEGFTVSQFFIGLCRLELLDQAAKAFVEGYTGLIDPVEVYLGLQVKLYEELKLPLLAKEMLYFSCSCLTDDTIKRISNSVSEQTGNPQQTLVDSRTWVNYITTRYAATDYNTLIEMDGITADDRDRFIAKKTREYLAREAIVPLKGISL